MLRGYLRLHTLLRQREERDAGGEEWGWNRSVSESKGVKQSKLVSKRDDEGESRVAEMAER